MPVNHTNKLSVYLIKSGDATTEAIFKNSVNLKSEPIGNVGTLYFGSSHVSSPSWVSKFYGSNFSNVFQGEDGSEKLKLFSASCRAALLVSTSGRNFVVTFGYGHTLLKPGVCEERFGLKVVLNIVDPENLRSIDKKNMSVTPKLSKEQMTKDGTAADFGIDIEQDLIQGVTGKSKDERFGQTITGKDVLSVSVKLDVGGIKDFLDLCFDKYQSNEYQTHFAWVDQVAEVKDPRIDKKLNSQLVEKINAGRFEKVWMAIPEIIQWEDVSEFNVEGIPNSSLGDDIHLEKFLSFLTEEEKVDLFSTLISRSVNCIGASSDSVLFSWKAYDCLYCEIELDGKIFILSNGKWYEINMDFAAKVSQAFNELRDVAPTLSLPNCQNGEHENVYNIRVAGIMPDTYNMDRKIISHGGGYGKIEFCDLLTKDKQFIHVKHYGASSVLSHLFSQGLVAGELFLSDKDFRDKVNRQVPAGYQLANPSEKPNPANYEIIFAIISKSENDIDIPFFSKVNLRNAKRRLDMFGFKKVSLLKISTDN